MALSAGTKLGPYEILAPIGAGGMGEVYKATDTRLERTVAIKVLPSHVASNPDVRARFEREARAVSSLNHPHICTLHDIGHQDGVDFIVMEHIEGETLADRLKKGALPFDDALQYGIEIADALDKAHRQGVVHRDLKPGNIMLTKSGAKLLDFGLAKLSVAGSGPDLSALPTEQKSLTQPGAILGTFQYMAPEQLEGKEADARTDVFAFGAVLYEMLTGHRAFEGKSQASLIGAILKDEPPPISTVQTMTPPALDHVVQRCLAKDPDDRWQTASDVLHELKWTSKEGSPAVGVAPAESARAGRRGVTPVLAAWLVGAIMAGVAVWALTSHAPDASLKRLSVSLPAEAPYAGPGGHALSPDGTRLVYGAVVGGRRQLYTRALDRFDPQLMPGTEDAATVFFSPDGEWVGFVTQPENKLKKVSVHGGPPLTLCDAIFLGGSWGAEDAIVFVAQSGGGLSLARVSASGGEPEVLTTPDIAKGERHGWPQILPGGEAVLFSITSGSFNVGQIAVLSLETGEYRTVVEPGYNAQYVPSGHIVYTVGGALMAAPFDVDGLETTGAPGPVLEGILTNPGLGGTSFAFSRDGSLAYVPGGSTPVAAATLALVDREGVASPLVEAPRFYTLPRFSPDGQRVAVTIRVEGDRDIWIYELARGTLTRLTFEGGAYGVWSPDGLQVAFGLGRAAGGPVSDILAKPADGSGEAAQLTPAENNNGLSPASWSPDGEVLVFAHLTGGGAGDIGVLPLGGEPKPELVLQATFRESHPKLSPDGRWLAYTSDESGQPEVYVQPFPDLVGKWQISTGGGTEPVWSPKGAELFYRTGDQMMVVQYGTEPTFSPSKPIVLFEGSYAPHSVNRAANYDVSPDGQHFVMVQPVQGTSAMTEINVVLNWFEELERLVPTDN